jgi:hypothetical protein
MKNTRVMEGQSMKKRQQISQCGTDLCATIPQRAVEAFDITTKRFFEWGKTPTEVIGTFCQSETVVTTRVQVANNGRYLAKILHAYVIQYTLKPTKQGGPMAIFEWDEATLQIRIPLKKV